MVGLLSRVHTALQVVGSLLASFRLIYSGNRVTAGPLENCWNVDPNDSHEADTKHRLCRLITSLLPAPWKCGRRNGEIKVLRNPDLSCQGFSMQNLENV